MVTLTRVQLALIAVPLIALLALAGSRLASLGTASGPASAAPVEVVESDGVAPPSIVVHVAGAVRRPGLLRLREGARVADAIRRAGGLRADGDGEALNLAAPVVDGQQVVVPERPTDGEPPVRQVGGGKVSLSVATVEQLDALPGIGPVTAQKIVAWRAGHALRSVDDLDAIPGIGAARIEQLRDLVVP